MGNSVVAEPRAVIATTNTGISARTAAVVMEGAVKIVSKAKVVETAVAGTARTILAATKTARFTAMVAAGAGAVVQPKSEGFIPDTTSTATRATPVDAKGARKAIIGLDADVPAMGYSPQGVTTPSSTNPAGTVDAAAKTAARATDITAVGLLASRGEGAATAALGSVSRWLADIKYYTSYGIRCEASLDRSNVAYLGNDCLTPLTAHRDRQKLGSSWLADDTAPTLLLLIGHQLLVICTGGHR